MLSAWLLCLYIKTWINVIVITIIDTAISYEAKN